MLGEAELHHASPQRRLLGPLPDQNQRRRPLGPLGQPSHRGQQRVDAFGEAIFADIEEIQRVLRRMDGFELMRKEPVQDDALQARRLADEGR